MTTISSLTLDAASTSHSGTRKVLTPSPSSSNYTWQVRNRDEGIDFPIIWFCANSIPFSIEVFGLTGSGTLEGFLIIGGGVQSTPLVMSPVAFLPFAINSKMHGQPYLIDIDRLRVDDNRFANEPNTEQNSNGLLRELDSIFIRMSRKDGLSSSASEFEYYKTNTGSRPPFEILSFYERAEPL